MSARLCCLAEAAATRRRWPSQISGGQCPRLCIARTLIVTPKVPIAGEAVSALGASGRKEALNLLNQIRDRSGLAPRFITHVLRATAQVCDHLIAMQWGEIVERGTVEAGFGAPLYKDAA